ncbi:MAG: DUF3795 domain-containing protein [Flexilinea sp.]
MSDVFTVKQVVESISYCGLVCCFCHRADECNGCRSERICCGKRLSTEGCFQYECCISKGIQGCWECEEGPCDRDMFSESHDIRNRTFVKCAKQEGVEKLAEYVLRNQKAGILYGWNRDYDNLGIEEAVLDLLHNGVKSRFYKG